ncbi:hypothetical protein ACWENO_20655 [Streptomyces sp. NPDC004436]
MIARPLPGWFAMVLNAGGGAEPVEGFAEVLDVVAWWSQPFQPGLSVVSFLGPGEGVVDGFAGGLLGEVAVHVGGG